MWTTAGLALINGPSLVFTFAQIASPFEPKLAPKESGTIPMPLRTIAEIVAILIIVILAIRFFKSRA